MKTRKEVNIGQKGCMMLPTVYKQIKKEIGEDNYE